MNRGTGAGGANTNLNGLPFEKKTSNIPHLVEQGFRHVQTDNTKNGFYLTKKFEDDSELVFVTQGGLKKYVKNVFGKHIHRCPDEAYIWKRNGMYTLYILEKKCQNVPGSVDTKLLAAYGFIKYYERALGIRTYYGFTLSDFLKNQWCSDTWKEERDMFEQDGIPIFFGDDETYFTKLHNWIGLTPELQLSEKTDPLNV
jgi:hypothetical protein